MYNFTVTKVAGAAVFRAAFTAGTCIGGVGGVLLGLIERSVIGVLGGAFLGLAFGLTVALTALAAATVFNLLVPHIGGIAVRLEPVPAEERPAADTESTVSSA